MWGRYNLPRIVIYGLQTRSPGTNKKPRFLKARWSSGLRAEAPILRLQSSPDYEFLGGSRTKPSFATVTWEGTTPEVDIASCWIITKIIEPKSQPKLLRFPQVNLRLHLWQIWKNSSTFVRNESHMSVTLSFARGTAFSGSAKSWN